MVPEVLHSVGFVAKFLGGHNMSLYSITNLNVEQ